ncbi:MAG: DUF1670 domain-containing protein, partial [Planctomycetes bacterium]|nr:DUF1670 domain-containing protein [Planctomycetota bacterium]
MRRGLCLLEEGGRSRVAHTARRTEETLMVEQTADRKAAQDRRLGLKSREHLLKAEAIKGAGLSPREAEMLVEEARAQEGLLSQEDLARLLGCGVRTIRRDVRELRLRGGIHLATRGQEKDIGRTLTHKPLIIRKLFLEGKSVEAVCRQTHHSPEAVHR